MRTSAFLMASDCIKLSSRSAEASHFDMAEEESQTKEAGCTIPWGSGAKYPVYEVILSATDVTCLRRTECGSFLRGPDRTIYCVGFRHPSAHFRLAESELKALPEVQSRECAIPKTRSPRC